MKVSIDNDHFVEANSVWCGANRSIFYTEIQTHPETHI